MSETIAIIGAGAAGCFCAAEILSRDANKKIHIFESRSSAMSKLAITGGGRCNITNSFARLASLSEAYPRGERLVRASFANLSPEDTYKWWEAAGVSLVTQEDQCVFPQSQDAMQVVRTLLSMTSGAEYSFNQKILSIIPQNDGFELISDKASLGHFNKLVLASGGGAVSLLGALDISIEPAVPSLFSFRLSDKSLASLMGTIVSEATVGLSNTKFRSTGELLITDWGLSGPAVLKLSSYAARYLAENAYKATIVLNYLSLSEEEVRNTLLKLKEEHPQKLLHSIAPGGLTQRLWRYLCSRISLREDMRWAELGSKGLSRLVSLLVCDSYEVIGRCRFKDEFVTAGGVSSKEVKPSTLESKKYKGLYFAGEVLDIDAITGGFNLQAAWSTAYTVAKAISSQAE